MKVSDVPDAMTVPQAVVLGVVEGLTEYLPVSSTGHLLLAQSLMGMGVQGVSREASEAYAICIQAGAILAVAWLYFGRLRGIVRGLRGADREGLRLGINLLAAFLPAVVIGLAFESAIKEHLFGGGQWGLWPIVAAWFAGGVVILVMDRRVGRGSGKLSTSNSQLSTSKSGSETSEAKPDSTLKVGSWKLKVESFRQQSALGMDALTWKMAVIIGLAQCLAMWPGVSRSLATILGGVAVGLSVGAAVEFSFLLGLITLGAATAVDALKHGEAMLTTYGIVTPLLGMLAALLAAAAAVKWMVRYLQRHGLAIFGYYRIALAAVVAAVLWWR